MKRNTIVSMILACMVFVAFSAQAQKIKIESGALDFLKGQSVVKVEYKYDGMAVGKFENEQDYIDKKVAEYNEKEAGKGDTWKESWVKDRETRYQPKYEELINKTLEDLAMKFDPNATDAQYTMIVHTTFTEPGYNIGISRAPALINVVITIVETGSRAEQVVISVLKSPGNGAMGYDFDAGFRISEAYAKCGKEIGKLIAKKLK